MIATKGGTKDAISNLAYVLIVLSIVLALVFLSGCVEKRFLPSQREEIEKAWGIDTNNDGIFDQYYAFFKPVEIGNITVKKEITSEKRVGNDVTVTLRIFGHKTETISNVELREVIPLTMTASLDRIRFNTPYDSVLKSDPPFIVSWKLTFSGEDEIERDISYTSTVYQEIDERWLEGMMTPYIEVEIINPKGNPAIMLFNIITKGYLDILIGSIPNYYIAVSLYISTLLAILFILYEFMTVFAAFISSMLKRVKFREEVYRFIGHGRKGNVIWVVAGAVMIVAGTILCVAFAETPGSAKLEMIPRISSNPAMAIGILILVIGFVSLLTVFIDIIKGIIFGEKYFFEPIDIAKERISEIKSLAAILQDKITECSDLGIGTETELLSLTAHKKRVDEMERNLDVENAEEYLPLIMRVLSDLSSEIIAIDEKKMLYGNWPVWREAIDKILIIKDAVAPEDLLSVPEEWRKWALTKYLSEHLGEALTIENGALTRMRIATVRKGEIDLVLNEFMSAGRIEGVALVRKDGLVIASILPKEVDANIVAAISAKVIANADMSSMELEKGKTKMVIINTSGGQTIIYSGKKTVLIAVVKAGEAVGFVVTGLEKVMEKLESMF
ncbi:MAG: roadblock/LC7 domain-containing protein [Candidatus Micrarchaeia archaeon]